MSGHSHFATIKRQKESNDAAKGKVFSKLARAVQVAVKTGGGSDPDSNYKLRMAIDIAKASNMPKDNIERAIKRAEGEGLSLEEIVYEGYGPEGVQVIVDATTDNRNRTSQEIKNIFDRGGGSLAGPGAVSFNFESKGMLLVKKNGNTDDLILKLIDLGAEDVDDAGDVIEVYTSLDNLHELKSKASENGLDVISAEIIKRPKTMVEIKDKDKANRILKLMDQLDDSEDVQKVFANFDIADGLIDNS